MSTCPNCKADCVDGAIECLKCGFLFDEPAGRTSNPQAAKPPSMQNAPGAKLGGRWSKLSPKQVISRTILTVAAVAIVALLAFIFYPSSESQFAFLQQPNVRLKAPSSWWWNKSETGSIGRSREGPVEARVELERFSSASLENREFLANVFQSNRLPEPVDVNGCLTFISPERRDGTLLLGLAMGMPLTRQVLLSKYRYILTGGSSSLLVSVSIHTTSEKLLWLDRLLHQRLFNEVEAIVSSIEPNPGSVPNCS